MQDPRTGYGATPLDSVTFTDGAGRAAVRVIAPTLADSGTITVSIGKVAMDQSSAGPMQLTIPLTTTPGAFATFAAHPMQRFAGATFAIDSLFTAADKYGNAVKGPTATFTATGGWRVSGNVLTPPTSSDVGATVVTATSGAVTASDTVAVVDDFRQYHWKFGWTCGSTPAGIAAGAADRVVAAGTYGVAIYPGDPGFQYVTERSGAGALDVAVEFRFTGTVTSYRNGVATSSVDILSGEPYNWDAVSQRPDAVVFGVDAYARTLVRTPGTLPSFVSPTAWCSGPTLHGLTLQAY